MRKAITFLLGALVVIWIIYTMYAVARVGGAVVADLETTSRIMAVRNDDRVHSAVGLTYHGLGGAALVIAEVAVVLTVLAIGLFGSGRRRLAAMLVLGVWTALWLGNALWLQSRGWDRPTDVALMGGAMLVTLVWIYLRLTGEPRASAAES